MRKQQLSPEQALVAMTIFLDRYQGRTGGSGDLLALLGDLQINPSDGRTCDPAAWTDWLEAVDEALERERLGVGGKIER